MKRGSRRAPQALVSFLAASSAVSGAYFGLATVRPHIDLVPPADVRVLGSESTASVADAVGFRPIALAIDDLSLSAPIRPVGLDDVGNLEVPDETEVGWYRYGGVPGGPGATVLAAHVSWNDTVGPFYRLDELDVGAVLDVLTESGPRRYEVVEFGLFPKETLPDERIWRSMGSEELVLITCGGEFDESTRRYRHNVVVFARPIVLPP